MKPDIEAVVRFLTTEEGGRNKSLGHGVVDFYAVSFFIDGKAFDCRVLLGGRCLELGQDYEVPVKFLNWSLVRPRAILNAEFKLLEGSKVVATGKVKALLNSSAQ